MNERLWEDAILTLWGELDAEQVKRLRDELPALMDFCSHLHHRVEHQAAMVRTNSWTSRARGEAE